MYMIIVLLLMDKLRIGIALMFLYVKENYKIELRCGVKCFPHPCNNKQWPKSCEFVWAVGIPRKVMIVLDARENVPSNDALRITRAFVRAAVNEILFQGSAVKGVVQITDRTLT